MASIKILIIENTSPIDREILNRLETLGFTVCASLSCGAEAAEKIPVMRPDLVMVNLGREGAMPAVEAAEKIYHHFNIPVIYLIDSIDDDVLERIKRAKVFSHIFKPFDAGQLSMGIEQQLHWHRANDKIAENEQRLSRILNGVGSAVIAADREGLITFMNPIAESLTGWLMEEASGNLVTDVLNVHVGNAGNLQKRPFLIEALQMRSGTLGGISSASEHDHNTWIVSKSGREIPIDVNITAIRDKGELITGFVITFHDITKYKTKDEKSNRIISELRHQTQLMKTVFDSMYDGIVVLDSNHEVLFLNPSIQQMFDQKLRDKTPSEWPETHGVYYADKKTLFPVYQILSTRIFHGESARDVELYVRNMEQAEGIHVKASVLPLFGENREVVACVCIVHDITKDKMAAIQLEHTMQELQNQVQLTDTIFNSIGDGVVAADANGVFTIFNPSAERILGIGSTDITPEKWSDNYGFFFPDRVTPFPADELPLACALKGVASDDVEMFVRNPEVPEGVFISVSGRPLQDEEGSERGGVIVFRDVTHRVIAEEALTQAFAQGRLEIVQTILHNIGNAINSVTVGLNVLQKNLVGNRLIHRFSALSDMVNAYEADWVDYIKDDPKGQQVLPFMIALAADFAAQNKTVVETLERVCERVTHITDIIRTQESSSQSSMSWKNIDLRQTIMSTLKLQQDSIDKRGIQVHVNCENAPQDIRVQESQFHQMLVNLVKNSIEAIDQLTQSCGFGDTPRIVIEAYINGDFLCLDVTDNGIGIAPQNLKLIFTAGYTTKESGSGLGLYSSANFVIGSGGQIYPLSEGIGKGTTMRIMLRCSSVIP